MYKYRVGAGNCAGACLEILHFLVVLAIACSVNLTFGILFYEFQKNDDFNDGCGDKKLKDWALATSILQFLCVGINILKAINLYCSRSSNSENSKDTQARGGCLLFLIGIALIVCAIALSAVDNDQCGQLHKLSMAFYIIFYVLLGLSLLVGLCTCIGKCFKGCSDK